MGSSHFPILESLAFQSCRFIQFLRSALEVASSAVSPRIHYHPTRPQTKTDRQAGRRQILWPASEDSPPPAPLQYSNTIDLNFPVPSSG